MSGADLSVFTVQEASGTLPLISKIFSPRNM